MKKIVRYYRVGRKIVRYSFAQLYWHNQDNGLMRKRKTKRLDENIKTFVFFSSTFIFFCSESIEIISIKL